MPPSSLLETSPDFSTSSPDWFRERTEGAWQTFQSLPMPGPKDEPWRYSNAKRIALADFQPASAASEAAEAEIAGRKNPLQESACRLVFVNDRLVLQEGDLPEGVSCLPLASALEQKGSLIEEHLMQREVELGSAKFAALHLAHLKAGVVVHVARGVEVASPLLIEHWVSGPQSAVFPHTLIVAEDQASVTVLDRYASADGETGMAIAVADFVAKVGARITYAQCQELNDTSIAVHLSSTTAHQDATVNSFQVQLGASFSRSESISDLVGKGSSSLMGSVSLPIEGQVVDQRTLQHHASPHTSSDLLYKNALYDTSRTVFSGLITVDEGAHYTDAYQTCRNLLSSEDAEANSMPGLEINADQVKCSHGSTSGPVSEEELFYLKARGIPDAAARQLIVQGFLEDTLSRLENSGLRSFIEERIEAKLDQLA